MRKLRLRSARHARSLSGVRGYAVSISVLTWRAWRLGVHQLR
jgi:hypothetical protein